MNRNRLKSRCWAEKKDHSRTRAADWHKLLLRPDMDGCLTFSKLRCVISIVSIDLLATDIPRSGLGVRRLGAYYHTAIMPDTIARFGPFDYPVRHIRRESSEIDKFYGLEGVDPVDSANVWSYQYDTTSLGLRGAVELLNVTEFPESLLYKGKRGNQNDILGLNTTFDMLDAFISTARSNLLREESPGVITPKVLRFATKHKWVDRVYQYLTRFVRPRRMWSLHTLHVPLIPPQAKSLRLCTATSDKRQPPRPRFCSYPGTWKCGHPVNASLPAVRLADQMDIRFQQLQRRYPDLVLDVALLSTHRPFVTSGTLSYTFFNCEDQEIVMLTRGRRCVGSDSTKERECTTMFVDDYRYEREMLETNVVDWHFFIAMMRGGAQGYFWVRLILLYRAAFIAAESVDADGLRRHSRGVSAALSVLKIPFQAIVYSSLLPVVCYVLALLLDGNFMDIYLDSYWSTLEGVMSIKLLPFVDLAVTQMRSVWLMALLVDLTVLVARKPIHGSEEKLPGIRGLAISFTSALTIIGPYRHPAFRSTEIESAMRLPAAGQRLDTVRASPQWYFNESTYLFDDSTTMLVVCAGAVALLASTVRLVSFLLREDQEVVLISTLNVPLGTERLWPTSSLSIRFNALTSCTPYQNGLQPRASFAKISPEPQLGPASTLRTPPPPSTIVDPTTKRSSEWRLRHLCGRKRISPVAPNIQLLTGGLASRTPQSHSILQLMNIAMMTDPWNLFWLRVLGINLHLYRIRASCSALDSSSVVFVPYAVILPYPEDEMEERTGLSCQEFQLVDSLSSRDLPMATLLQSG
ncbi:hypothetical protein PR003_g15237 [Phytophthora rubi]|uniref:Uncharacterized protein n=1 Tax=Phytophthora rubi TaxID=129364 RepID=A0A6A4F186_9STRA|nr:hypothetical protein PR002_g12882 [Phytophthora rubi]KAE9024839.1 hypothetical protein PR001_g12575 [Phytophthora rubi]KAE9330772.1 hypothetical protein PR003_g15237 [Phytophthora rubi]